MRRLGLVLLLIGLSWQTARAAIESQDYVLDQPTINYGTADSNSAQNDLYGTIGAGGLSDSINSQTQVGSAEHVLPSPELPVLVAVGESNIRISIQPGSNDPYVEFHVELSSDRGDSISLDGNGQAGADAWSPAAIWSEGVTVRDLARNRTYTVRARARAERESVSDWSRSAELRLGQALVGGGWLPTTITKPIQDWFQTPTGQAVGNILDKGLLPVVIATAAIQVAAAASLLGQLLLDFVLKLVTGVSPLFQYLVFFRRRRPYGLVVDGRRRRPVANATASLLRPDTKTILDTQSTDQNGHYFFTVDTRSSYLLRIEAPEHDVYERLCRGTAVNRLVQLGVALEYSPSRLHRKQRTDRLLAWLNAWRLPLLVIGTAMWFLLYLRDGGFVFWLGLYYILAWVLELFIHTQPAPFGIVTDAVTGEPLSGAVIRVYGLGGRLAQTLVTNRQGRFSTLLRSGSYELRVSCRGYETGKRPRTLFTRQGSVQAIRVSLKPIL